VPVVPEVQRDGDGDGRGHACDEDLRPVRGRRSDAAGEREKKRRGAFSSLTAPRWKSRFARSVPPERAYRALAGCWWAWSAKSISRGGWSVENALKVALW